ncbi:organic solute transporter alpha-like protein [Onthophagus taurus]|uniref:organic solute transporter alpha-like protein n=1 Tax=Onthophagus taurus TaxID=166361 RepID=UPI000C2061A3|nr:organic solute transporter alpha-like protein [Onthophagus taurus]
MDNFEEIEVITEKIRKFGLNKMILMNKTCNSEVPSSFEYLSAINVYGITLLFIGGLAVLLILYTFIDTLKYIIEHSSSRVKTHSTFVIGVYPVVALSTFCAILVPRAHLLAEAMTQGTFMVGMYQLFCLFVAYCGGEAEMINRTKPDELNLKVGPCCCCCLFLPSISINKNRITYLRLLVLQLPMVQGLVYATLLVLWAERESLYQVNYMYFQPIIVLSILIGIWSMTITINLLKNRLVDYNMQGKFFVLQMVLMFAKLQALITKIPVWTGLLPCNPPITPTMYGNLIHNTLMLAEMVLLGFIARKLYKKKLPDLEPIQNGFVIKTIGAMVLQESNNNNNSNSQLDNPSNTNPSFQY